MPYLFEIRNKVINFTNKIDKNKVKFYWVPSHKGNLGNELADHHAKEASNNAAIDKWKIPFTDLKEIARKTARDNTNTLMTEYGSGIEFIKNYHNNKSKPWFYRKNLPREIVTMINRGRSNHYSLAASLAKIHIIDSPRCECGYETEDLNHVLWQCNK